MIAARGIAEAVAAAAAGTAEVEGAADGIVEAVAAAAGIVADQAVIVAAPAEIEVGPAVIAVDKAEIEAVPKGKIVPQHNRYRKGHGKGRPGPGTPELPGKDSRLQGVPLTRNVSGSA